MADKKGSALPTTTTTTGIYIPILLPDGGSPTGFEDYRILLSTAQAPLQALVNTNKTNIATNVGNIAALQNMVSRQQYFNKVSNTQFAQPFQSKITKICARGVSSGTLMIGTTDGGNDILPLTIITSEYLEYEDTFYTLTARTLYITITGTINIEIEYLKNTI